MALQGIMKDKDSRSNLLEWKKKTKKTTTEKTIKKIPPEVHTKKKQPQNSCLEMKLDKLVIPVYHLFGITSTF